MTFYNKQLKASYIPYKLQEFINTLNFEDKHEILKYFSYVSNFELISNFKLNSLPENNKIRILSLIAQNIVRRGFPTLAPNILDKAISSNMSDINFNLLKESLILYDKNYAFKSNRRYYQKTLSNTLEISNLNLTELEFITEKLPSKIAQHIEFQKPFETIVMHPNTNAKNYQNYTSFCLGVTLNKILEQVSNQRIDFCLQIPSKENNSCIAIELDGPQHQTDIVQKAKDNQRDSLLNELLWQQTLRITDINQQDNYLTKLSEIFQQYAPEKEISSNITSDIHLCLFSARVTLMFLTLIECGSINLTKENRIYLSANTENEIEFKAILIGIQNAIHLIYNLIRLENSIDTFPNAIILKIESNNITHYVKFTQDSWEFISYNEKSFPAILHINSRMYQRLFAFNPNNTSKKTIWLYSSYAEDTNQLIRSHNKPINYNINDNNISSLIYFLNNIFKKDAFRPKQIDIIKEALGRKNVIGLLPTGSGKTLTYQLTAILQPGITIVIAPLISLMNDQVHNLNKIGIHSCTAINSSFNSVEKRLIMKNLSNEKYQYIYISPERLQIKEFKDLLSKLNIFNIILDEAHCVSQWGHDFRTSYLRVGETISSLFKKSISMALTGTASCNVITDIKRELQMSKNVMIVTPNNFKRDELNFRIIETDKNISLEEKINSNIIKDSIQKTIHYLYQVNNKDINYELEEQLFFEKDASQNKYINSGLIFCPYAKSKSGSVETLYNSMKPLFDKKNIKIGYYHGAMPTSKKNTFQEKFTNNELALLIATKAFGMGIDKPNIRFTIHTCIPESIEAFYQEAGRAGRDRKNAVNIIISPPLSTRYSDTVDSKIYNYFINNSFPDAQSFKKQIKTFLYEKTITITKFNDFLLKSLSKQYISSSDVDISYNPNIDNVVLTINNSNQYSITMNDNHTIAIEPIISSIPNFIYSLYEKYIKNTIKKELEANTILTSKNLKASFNVRKFTAEDSIIDSLKKTSSDNDIYCYIGLENSINFNPIDTILKDLVEEKHSSIILNKETHSILKNFKEKFYPFMKSSARISILKDFYYKIYNVIRMNNRLLQQDFQTYNQKYIKEQPISNISGLKEKILYYLGILGIYSNYERSYSPNFIKIKLNKPTKESLRNNIKKYISSYETADYVNRTMKKFKEFDNIPEDDIDNLVTSAINYVVEYSYSKIRHYREKQSENMYLCMQANDNKHPQKFIDEIYKYFESKYSDELLKDILNENLNLPFKWIEKVSSSTQNNNENFLENLSHLRSSALKVQEARPQAYTPYFLYAYSIFNDHNLDIRSGINAYIRAVNNLSKLREQYKSTLKNICTKFFNTEDISYLNEVLLILNKEYLLKENTQPILNEFKQILLSKIQIKETIL